MNELDSWNRKWRTLWCWTHIYVHFKRAQIHARNLSEEARYAYWNEKHSHFAELIWKNISELRGWWVKVGQFLSTRSDLLPREYISYLSKLQDMMPSSEWLIVEKILESELNNDWRVFFEKINTSPMASASIAQVHEALLKDGTKVVVKIQHPNVEETLNQDMKNLTQLSWAFGIIEKGLDFYPILQEWQKSASKELDFNNELKYQQKAYEMFINSGIDIKIPKVYPEYSRQKVLTMEYIDGFKITDKAKLEESGVNLKELLETLCDSFAYQIHIEGFFHGDPHPGNVFVVYNKAKNKYEPALLDWGLVKVFEKNVQRAFSKMVYCVSTLNLMGLMESFEEMGFKFKDNKNTIDPEMYMDALRIAFRDSEINQSEQESIRESGYAAYKTATELPHFNKKSIQEINPLEEWPKDIILFIRVSSLIHGICIELNESIPFLKILAKRAQENLYCESFKTAINVIKNFDKNTSSCDYIVKNSNIRTKYNIKMNNYVSRLIKEDGVLGIQMSVVKNGKLLSNISKGKMGVLDCRDISSDSLFNGFFINIGILVVAILLCVDKGYIELDDPICHYWDGFVRYGKRNVTLRHVLTHRSGIHSFFSEDFSLSTLFSYEKVIKIIEDSTPEYPLNSKTIYNPFLLGWILSELISLVSNQPTPDFINDNLFIPFDLQKDMMIYIPKENNGNNNNNSGVDYRNKDIEANSGKIESKKSIIFDFLSPNKKSQFSFFSPQRFNTIIGLDRENYFEKVEHSNNKSRIKSDEDHEKKKNKSDISNRLTKVSRKIEFSSISHEMVLKKFESATNYMKSNNECNEEHGKLSKRQIKCSVINREKNKRLTTFQLFKLKPYVFDPLIYNSKKVLSMWIPPTNGKYNSSSLSKFYYYIGSGRIISKNLINEILKTVFCDHTLEGLILTSGGSRRWSLGFQVLECEYNPAKVDLYYRKNKVNSPIEGKIYFGIGHSDIGGNLSFTFPELDLSFSILSNDYIKGSYVSKILTNYILESFGLVMKNYVPIRL
ncbi:putative ABC1 family beta-lactamase [Cryptosporidium ryanae]|uniref:putative ABC1 family beta-lactamase n=1 Tax=Cryptosporidium ryanae TaxID=515981 RepID=UPI00351A20AC|nr:putative ABC1 family beta-lactamase [Cryptosporidium ryanae]